jgi:hypothetical protein
MTRHNLAVCLVAAALSVQTHGGEAVPAREILFTVKEAGRTQKIQALVAADKIRVNQPDEKFALLYESAGQLYTGLELRDAHYWQFRWPEVEAAIRESRRYADRLRNLDIEGLASYDLERPAANESAASSPPLYRWKPGGKKKRIGAYECELWLGQSEQAPAVEAWCVETQVPLFHELLERLREINEPMALAPLRPLLPPLYFVVAESLRKAGVTPVELSWTQHSSPSQVTFQGAGEKKTESGQWKIPEGYLKSEMGALEGITPRPVAR